MPKERIQRAQEKPAREFRISWIGRVSPSDGLELVVFHLDQHSAIRWMAVHGTHGPDDFRATSSNGRLRPRHCAFRVNLPEMD